VRSSPKAKDARKRHLAQHLRYQTKLPARSGDKKEYERLRVLEGEMTVKKKARHPPNVKMQIVFFCPENLTFEETKSQWKNNH
jgi:hypothetical protein